MDARAMDAVAPPLDMGAGCSGSMTACAGSCVDLQTSRDHCGACGTACPGGQVCVAGSCQVSCPAGSTMCGSGSGVTCVSTSTDNANCGACGHACGAGQVCSMGACGTSCGAGLATCGGDGGAGASCADTQTDRLNCGACGHACPAGNVCMGGACVLSCPGGQAACGGACANLQTDLANCGACGHACAAGEVCSMGTCAASCGAGLTACSGGGGDAGADGGSGAARCADLQTDRANCGACGTACAAGFVCVGGGCTVSCGAGLTTCGAGPLATCANLTTDNANCGACGTVCPAGTMCSAGHCDTTCGAPLVACGAPPACTNTSIDPSNCGACGTACAAAPHALAACSGGRCGLVCAAGFGDCDSNASNGCETDTTSSTAHCGACGTVCALGAHVATATCTAGACGVGTCAPGWGNCDGDASNGCETDLTSTAAHCGACGTACAAGLACTAGVCGSHCYTGPARVLVYGPGGTVGDPWFPAGTVVTVASDAMWRSLTTADFGNYDVIWMAGNNCSGTVSSVFGTASATIAAWGPAVRGRIELLTGDPDLHGGTGAQNFYANSVRWLAANGRNVDGGRTSLYISWGCTLVGSYTAGGVGTPEDFASVLGAGITGNSMNVCTSFTTTAAGVASPVLVGVQPGYWGCPFHGALASVPVAYSQLVLSSASSTLATLVTRESPSACVP